MKKFFSIFLLCVMANGLYGMKSFEDNKTVVVNAMRVIRDASVALLPENQGYFEYCYHEEKAKLLRGQPISDQDRDAIIAKYNEQWPLLQNRLNKVAVLHSVSKVLFYVMQYKPELRGRCETLLENIEAQPTISHEDRYSIIERMNKFRMWILGHA